MADSAVLLQQLRDIHLPPTAPEPTVLPVVLSLVAVALLLLVILRRLRASRYRWAVAAHSELDLIQQHYPDQAIQQYARLLKQIALTVDDSPEISKLNGRDWLEYLDAFFSTDYFSVGDGQVFGDAIYQVQTTDVTKATAQANQIKKLIKRKSRRW